MFKEDLWVKSACDMVDLLRKREISPIDALDSLEARIAAVDDKVNALPTLCFKRARAAARARPADLSDILCGLPVAIKDSIPVAGVRSTYGSRVFADNIPDRSDAVATTIEAHGGLIYAKSNTPEFEAGANTFNEVFGATRNPWNTDWSAGGSSGGAAVAAATGMAWLAQGTDFACSLRNPAAFCGVVGLRPGIGLVPMGPSRAPFQTLSVAGPIARTVADCGLFLDAMCGAATCDPYTAASPRNPKEFRTAAGRPERPARMAFSADLGITPVAASVRNVLNDAVAKLERAGVTPVPVAPDLGAAHGAFRTLRALQFATAWGHLLPAQRDLLKPDVTWNIEEGQALSAQTIIRAEHDRAAIRTRVIDILTQHEFLMIPTSIVPPYPLTQRYVAECEGVTFDNYLEWMAIAYVITLTGCPAISVPAGLTPQGQPVGIQIVAAPGREAALLSVAAFVEGVLGARLDHPMDPVVPEEDDQCDS